MSIVASTYILCSEGPQRASNLNQGFDVVTNGFNLCHQALRVVPDRSLVHLTTSRGYEITVSVDQEMLIESGRGRVVGGASVGRTHWIPASSIIPGTILVLANNRRVIDVVDQTQFERGWLLGQILGNGGHNPNNSSGTYLRFWMPHHAELAEIADRIIRSMGVSKHYSGGAYNEVHQTLSIKTTALEGYVSPFLERGTKLITPTLVESNQSLVRGFLRGFFDADGTVSGDKIKGQSVRLNQSSRDNLITVQRMLSRFGIASSILLRREAGTSMLPNSKGVSQSYVTKANYEVLIGKDNIGVFEAAIGFYDREKGAKLATFTAPSIRKPYAEQFTAKVISVEERPSQPSYETVANRTMEVDANGFRIRL